MQHQPLGHLSYIDDGNFNVIMNSAAALYRILPLLVSTVVDVFAAHALKLNMKRGKSESQVCFRGKHALHYHKLIFLMDTPGVHFEAKAIGKSFVHCVLAYRHVGSTLSLHRGSEQEIHVQLQSGVTAANNVRFGIMSKKGLKAATKFTLSKSWVFSRMFWAAATWFPFSATSQKKVYVQYTRYASHAHGKANGELITPMSDRDFYASCKVEHLSFLS